MQPNPRESLEPRPQAPRPQSVQELVSAPRPAAPQPAAAGPIDRRRKSAEAGAWTVDSGISVVQPRSATEVLRTLANKVNEGTVDHYQPVPLGFTPLDKTIGGGLRAGELLLIGGAQGTGKTTMAVQMARNIVLGGQASVLYICFEHDEEYLLNRIIAMESILAQLPTKTGGVKLQDVRREILGTWLAQGTETADLSANPRLQAGPRTDRPLRPEPLPAARLAVDEHGREHAGPRRALQGDLRRPAAGRVRRLHAEGPGPSPNRRPSSRR